MPHPRSPIQDPYLGRQALHAFDLLIPPSMELNTKIAAWTHGRPLSRLQRAGCEIIPNGISIVLSIRELVRCGYLFSADILLRPVLERIAVISYLAAKGDAVLDLWERGWPHKSRPPLREMIGSIGEFGRFRDQTGEDMQTHTDDLVKHFNSVVHADPSGLATNIGLSLQQTIGHLSGASVHDAAKCNRICILAAIYLSMLIKRAAETFPAALEEAGK